MLSDNQSSRSVWKRGDKTSLLIAGDSHTISFGLPLKSADGSNHRIKLEHYGEDVFGVVGAWPRQFDAYWDAVEKNAEESSVVALWGGNIHLANFLFAPSPLFDYVVSSTPDLPLDSAVEIIPEEVIRAVFSKPIDLLKDRLLAMNSRGMRVLVPGTPPPKEDDAFIRQYVDTEPHFQRLAAQVGLRAADVPLSPAILRLKLWMTLQGLLGDMAREAGATFVPVPTAARNESGFLARECYRDDVTHANLTFGSIMIEELRNAAIETSTRVGA